MKSLGFEQKNHTIYQMIKDIDKDGNGELDFDECESPRLCVCADSFALTRIIENMKSSI